MLRWGVCYHSKKGVLVEMVFRPSLVRCQIVIFEVKDFFLPAMKKIVKYESKTASWTKALFSD
jgi:hypothetical protein